MADYICDIETDGIEATKLHCMSVQIEDTIASYTSSQAIRVFLLNLTKDDRIIGHNFIRYDAPTLERLLGIEIKAQIVDTLALSWYLYPERGRHGLEGWGEDLGVAKPTITNWTNLPIEEYVNRCEEDVKINKLLWDVQSEMLDKVYEGKPQALIRYLMFKMDCARLQESSKWKLDVANTSTLLEQLEDKYAHSVEQLAGLMPLVPKYAKRQRPAKPYKKDGTLSATGLRWDKLTKDMGLPFEHDEEVKELVDMVAPNPSSVSQIKDWLDGLGWEPETFDFKPDQRKVPQIKTKSGDLCKSVVRLGDIHPEVLLLDDMAVIKHRIGLLKGFLKSVDDSGHVIAAVQGLTNTLRFKHAVCVNLPSLRKPYGKEIRGLLTTTGSKELCGSDMCSLEDRTKQHYMWEYDPEYVKQMMSDDFDPHLDLALSAGALTQQQVNDYKNGDQPSDVTNIRHIYKGGNYACTYGAGVATLSKQLNISEKEAGKVHKAYWKRNWAVKQIAKDATTKSVEGRLWLYNPVSKLYYSLRNEKDIFSTLNQGTGTFCFDMWVGFVLNKRKQLTAQFHDEIIIDIKEGNREGCTKLLKDSVNKVNNYLGLNRDLDCDVQFGKNYSEIH